MPRSLNDLPNEVLEMILSFLEFKDCIRVSSTCKSLQSIALGSIRHLSIRLEPCSWQKAREKASAEEVNIHKEQIKSILMQNRNNLRRLQSLELDCGMQDMNRDFERFLAIDINLKMTLKSLTIWHCVIFFPNTCWPNVTHLELSYEERYIPVPSWTQLVQVINTWPCLTTVKCKRLGLGIESGRLNANQGIKRMELEFVPSSYRMHELMDTDAVQTEILTMLHGLEHLQFKVTGVVHSKTFAPLRYCHNLPTCDTLRYLDVGDISWSRLHSLLNRCYPSVETLCINVGFFGTGILGTLLQWFPRLNQLELVHNPYVGNPMDDFIVFDPVKSLPPLKSLQLDRIRLTANEWQCLSQCPLNDLTFCVRGYVDRISDNEIKWLFEVIARLPYLKELHISCPKISRDHWAALDEFFRERCVTLNAPDLCLPPVMKVVEINKVAALNGLEYAPQLKQLTVYGDKMLKRANDLSPSLEVARLDRSFPSVLAGCSKLRQFEVRVLGNQHLNDLRQVIAENPKLARIKIWCSKTEKEACDKLQGDFGHIAIKVWK